MMIVCRNVSDYIKKAGRIQLKNDADRYLRVLIECQSRDAMQALEQTLNIRTANSAKEVFEPRENDLSLPVADGGTDHECQRPGGVRGT